MLHVIPSLSKVHGGPSKAMLLIEQSLQQVGIDVEIATTDDDGHGKRRRISAAPATMAATACDPATERFAGQAAGRPPIRHYFPKRLNFYKVSPAFARWIFLHVRDYDLVHVHALFSFTSVMAAWAARRAGVPYIVRPLGTLNRYGVTQRRPWLKQLSLKLIEGPILRHASVVHFTADAEREDAESLGLSMRGVVIPIGIAPLPQQDASVFLARFPQLAHRRITLFLSRLDRVKNVESLLRAFAQLRESFPNATLVIAGDGEPAYVAGLKRLADELGLADRIVWAGFVDGELKASAFAAAEVFVLPSFSENFGIAAAEALMAGLPCVLGEGVAIADEVARAGAGVVTAPDPEAIAAALRRVLTSDAQREDMGRRARALASEKYSLAAMGAALHALYSRILAQKSSGQVA